MKEYREQFLPQITRVGRFIMVISLLLFFVPFFVLWFVYGVQPQWSHLVKALVPWLLINLPWWISNPISYFPILGIPGTLLCFLSGNIANMRIPAGVAAQKAAEVEAGSEKGILMSTIGVSMSVYVNLFILAAGVIAGEAVLSALPQSFSDALGYLLPSLFGCVFASFMVGNGFASAVAIGSALLLTIGYNSGMFGFIPFDTSIFVMLLPIAAAVAAAYFAAGKKKGAAETNAAEMSTAETDTADKADADTVLPAAAGTMNAAAAQVVGDLPAEEASDGDPQNP